MPSSFVSFFLCLILRFCITRQKRLLAILVSRISFKNFFYVELCCVSSPRKKLWPLLEAMCRQPESTTGTPADEVTPGSWVDGAGLPSAATTTRVEFNKNGVDCFELGGWKTRQSPSGRICASWVLRGAKLHGTWCGSGRQLAATRCIANRSTRVCRPP